MACLIGEGLGSPRFYDAGGLALMAVTTALAVLGLSVALILQQVRPRGVGARLAAAMAASIGSVSVAILLRDLIRPDLRWAWEVALAGAAMTGPANPPVHMATATAGVVVLDAFSLLVLALAAKGRTTVRRMGLAAAVVAAAGCGASAASDVVGLPLLFASGRLPMHLWTAITLAILSVALALASRVDRLLRELLFGKGDAGLARTPRERRLRLAVLGAAMGLGTFVLALGAGYLRFHVGQMRSDVGADLAAVADFKSKQIAQWLDERLHDARALMRAPLLDTAGSIAGRERETAAFLDGFREAYRYRSVMLLTHDLAVVSSSPDGRDVLGARERTLLGAALRDHTARLSDIQAGPDGVPVLEVAAPLLGGELESAVGAVLLQVDARDRLFPMLLAWPSDSETAEVLLFRRDGESVVYLSPTRAGSESLPWFRGSVHQPNLVTTESLLAPAGGPVEGLDYRGVDVIAVGRAVAGAPWMLLAKIDLSEAYESARRDAMTVALGLASLLLVSSLGVGFLWRQRHDTLIERQRVAERERLEVAERLALVLRFANDCFILLDEDLRIVDVNERGQALYGYSRAEFLQLKVFDLRTSEELPTFAGDLARANRPEGAIFETVHRRKDGTTFPVEVSARPVVVAGRPFRMALMRDITVRRAAARQIERLSRLYRAQSEVSEAIVHAHDRQTLLQEICRILVETGGFHLAWVGVEGEARRIVPQARFGDATGYLDDVVIVADDRPEGRGPTGSAIRTGSVSVVNDFAADPLTAPWHEVAARAGLRSSLALPLRQGGRIVAALTVYADEKDFFGEREIALAAGTGRELSFAFDFLAGREEQRQARVALERSEARLRFLVAATPAILYTCRASDFWPTFVSENVAAILGYEPRAFIDDFDFWGSHLHPDDAAVAVATPLDLSARPLVREYRFRHRDGTYRWLQDEARLILDDTGSATIVGCLIDVSGRKRAEEALREREAIYSSIVNQALDAMALIDPESGRFVEFNEAAHRDLGYTREEFAALAVADVQAQFSPQEFAVQQEWLRAVDQTTLETRHRGRDGNIRDVEVRARKIRVRDREFVAAAWTDITERKRIEQELRKSEERYRLIAEHTEDMIWLGDVATRTISYVSPAVRRLGGYEPEEVLGQPMRLALPPSTLKLMESKLPERIAAFESGDASARSRGYEVELRRRDGSLVWTETVISLLPDASGTVRQLLGVSRDIGKRRRAEEEQRKLSRVVEQSPVSIVITDPTGAIEYANPYFTAITGYPFEEVRGANPRVLKSGRTPEATYAEMWRTLKSGGVWRGELCNRKKDGSFYTELAVIAPVVDSTGATTHYVAIKEDISDRKRAEAALSDSEERYRLIADNTADVIWLYDLDAGRFAYVSPSVMGLRGVAPDEVVGKTMQEALPPESAARFTRELAERLAAMARGEVAARTVVSELDHVHRDGSLVPTEVVTTLLTDAQGRVNRILGVSRDIRDRVQAARELKRGRDRLAEAQRMAHLGSWDMDLATHAMTWSDEMYRIFELEPHPAELVFGKDMLPRVHPDDRERVQQELARAIERGEQFVSVHRLLLPGARSKHVQARGQIGFGADRMPARMTGTLQDITERRQAELELREERASLARRVQERTGELSRANADLARAVRTKDEFLANMSHELRTPLNAILALSESLLEQLRGPLNERQQASLRTIGDSGHHLLELINDILDLSKVEAGRLELQRERVTLADVCAAGLAFVKETAARKQLRLTFELAQPLAYLEADAKRLKQMLVNLLSNAVKFTEPGGAVSLVVTIDEEAGVARLAVRDTGIGIAPEGLQRLFRPFTQLDSSLSRQHDGTGLGLALVGRLAELHGGGVSVESTPGRGSCFTISLPQASAGGPSDGSAAPRAAAAAGTAPATASARMQGVGILLVEDNEVNIEVMGDYLADRGYRVVVARNGREALDLAAQARPALILMDIQMPEMDGLEATRRLRADASFAETPIVALTALAMTGDRERCLAAGADEYLTKPVGLKQLVQTIESLLRR